MLEQTTSNEAKRENTVELAGERGGIAIPAVLWFAGVPFFAVVLLWLFFFRG